MYLSILIIIILPITIIDEKNAKLKESIGKKVEEYLNRAEQLKKVIAEGPKKKAMPQGGDGKYSLKFCIFFLIFY